MTHSQARLVVIVIASLTVVLAEVAIYAGAPGMWAGALTACAIVLMFSLRK